MSPVICVKLRVLFAAFVLSLASSLFAQGAATEKLLIPIFFNGEISGAHGSLWTSQLAITNRGTDAVGLKGVYTLCPFDPCEVDPEPLVPLAPEATIFPWPANLGRAFPPGSFLLVEEGRMDDLALSLRIQDVSRQALTWGTEIPVVRESAAFTGPADLLNVPVDERFRVLVRVYDFDPAANHRVKISGYWIDPRFYSPQNPFEGFRLIFETERDLAYVEPSPGSAPESLPGYVQIDLSEVEIPGFVESLRIRVEPLTEGLRFWPFASVTNNETQHVTTVKPY